MIDKKKLPKPAIMNPNYISLPSEWDSSVSQLEMLQRMLWNINQIIGVMGEFAEQTGIVETQLSDLLDNINEYMSKWIEEYFALQMIWFGLTDDGHFVAYIPDSWDEIIFNTTGYDIIIDVQPEYGHLVLSLEEGE